MRAVKIDPAFGLENLKFVESDVPTPGPGQVLVRVRAVSLNYRDLMTVKGQYNPRQPLPLVPLSDGAGEVEAVGEGVRSVKPGDRVTSTFFQKWEGGKLSQQGRASTLGGPLGGMLSEYVVLREEGVLPFPEHLSFEEAATLPCAALTAWNALVFQGHVAAGETVLALGTGGVSIFALQFAKLCGASVIITSGSDEKLERAKALGAMHGINYKTTPDWEKRVAELTGKAGVDHVVEVGGAGTFSRSLASAKAGGRVSVIGALSGGAEQLSIIPILMRSLTVQGIFVGSRQMFEAMNHAIALHQMHPVVDRIFSLDETVAAFEMMEHGSHFGKIVIRV
jgi:NADPH:quinone reductase-like Zn-dependent oxidoreductase